MNLNDYGYSTDYEYQCAAWTLNPYGKVRKQCGLRVVENIDGWIYLCRRHYELVERGFADRIGSLNAVRVENLQKRLEAAEQMAEIAQEGINHRDLKVGLARFEHRRKEQTVYFIRCQQFVKIGISKNPAARLQQIRRGGGSHFPRLLDVETSELIATEPGGLERERELHKKFHKLRHTGEWFTETSQLTKYIDSLTERQAA